MVRTIALANRQYYLTHGQYSMDINELDIDFPGEDLLANGVPSKETQHFFYRARGMSDTNMIAVARRKDKGCFFYVFNTSPEKMRCSCDSATLLHYCLEAGAVREGGQYVVQ